MKALLFSFVFVITSTAVAGPRLEALRAQTHRPTISQVKDALAEDRETGNPYADRSAFHRQSEEWVPSLAKIIAQFEKGYPGAVYVPLGRDMVMLGDMMDAFYLSRGEQGRVLRLNASSPTIRGVTDHARVQFLRTQGIRLEDLLRGQTYVIFDLTFYNDDSQSKGLLNAIYRHHVANGGKASDLVERLAFLNVYIMGKNGTTIDEALDRETFLTQAKVLADESKQAPQTHLRLKVDPASGFHIYTVEWHDKFSQLQSDFMTVPGAQNDEYKPNVLGELIDVIEQVETSSFHQLVEEEALKLNITLKPQAESCAATLKGS